MAKKTVSVYQSPLDRFLAQSDNGESRLAIIARQFAAEPFNGDTYSADLIAKLKRLRYPQPKPTDSRRTFYEILKDSGVLEALLHRDVLLALWKCNLLRKIVGRDRSIEEEHLSVEGKPVRFHRDRYREIERDLKMIEKLGETYNAREEAEKLSEKVSPKFRHHVTTLLISTRYTGSRAELLAGRAANELSTAPRNEDSACQVHIFRILKQALQTARTRRAGISDIFLCQLSELIWAAPNAPELTDGETLSKAIKRFKD